MITAYRFRAFRNYQDWSLFSDLDAKCDVRIWLDESGYGHVKISKPVGLPAGPGSTLIEVVTLEDPPEDLKMLIKLSFPTLVSVMQGLCR